MAPIAESLHAYWPNGEPAYEVPSVSGDKMVKTTVREMRRLGLLPSPSAVLGQLSKPFLINWFVERAYNTGYAVGRDWHNTRYGEWDPEEFCAKCKEIDASKTEARDEGTAIHAAIEQHLRGETCDAKYADWVGRTMAVLEHYGPREGWIPEATFACLEFGYGGRPDIRNTVSYATVDIKTRKFKRKNGAVESPTPYPEESMQLAAYRYPFGNKGVCVNLYIDRDEPLVEPYEHTAEDIDKAWECFTALLKVYQLSKNLPCPQRQREAKAA